MQLYWHTQRICSSLMSTMLPDLLSALSASKLVPQQTSILLLTSVIILLPADLLHEFMDHMHSAQPRLSAVCSCVEEYVEKLTFLAELTQLNKVMDAACAQVGLRGLAAVGRCWRIAAAAILLLASSLPCNG